MASLLAHVRAIRERTLFTSTLRATLLVLRETMVQLPIHDSVSVVKLTPLLSSWQRTLPKNVLLLTFDDEL